MMKQLIYILAAVAVLVSGCKKSTEDGGKTSERAENEIVLGVSGVSVSVENGSTLSRAMGSSMDELSDFGADNVALYGVVDNPNTNTQTWAKADRIIDTTGATIAADGRITFSKLKKYYPAVGYLSVYSIYPAIGNNNYVTITDNPVSTVPVSALVTLQPKFADQYDVLLGRGERFTITQAQDAKVDYQHALAQLRFKIKRDADVTARVTKIEVKGVSKGTIANITKPEFTNSTDALDSLMFAVYDGAAVVVTETAATIGDPLMLLPGVGSVSKVVITIDGITYDSYIPATWDLYQGKINTVTLSIHKFGVRLEQEWTVSNWGAGQGQSGDLENNGKLIRVSSKMLDAFGNATASKTPKYVDVEINGNYTHKKIEVETISNGLFVTKSFNSGMLNNEPLYMTAITLYDVDNAPIFQGKLRGGVTSQGGRVEIDTVNSGRLKYDNTTGVDFNLNIAFGGLGSGTEANPFEVEVPMHLDNIRQFLGSSGGNMNGTSTGGAFFKQIADIDIAPNLAIKYDGASFVSNDNRALPNIGDGSGWVPVLNFYSNYDGNNHRISGLYINRNSYTKLVGLFGSAYKNGANKAKIANITIASGMVVGGNGGVAAIVGSSSASIENCHNYAEVRAISTSTSSSSQAGGIAGLITGCSITNSSNHAPVTAGFQHAGGVFGASKSNCKVSSCFNTGAVTATNFIGGVGGDVLATEITSSYNTGDVTATGAVLAGISGDFNAASFVANSYNVGTVSTTYSNKIGVGGVSSISGTPNAGNVNSYFKQQTPEIFGIGRKGTNDGASPKTEAEMKSLDFVQALGSEFEADTKMINNGYPVLKWQNK